MDNKQKSPQKTSDKAKQQAPTKGDKETRLETALKNNLARRKEAQKSRPHRKNLPICS